MHNLRGADLILEAVKRDGKNEIKHLTPVGKINKYMLLLKFSASEQASGTPSL